MKPGGRLSWMEQSPEWRFFPVLKQQKNNAGWFRSSYTDANGSIWSLLLLGSVVQFKEVGSPSNVLH